MESLLIELGLAWNSFTSRLSTVRVDSGLESHHRFLGFDGFSDFLGNLDERILLRDTTTSMTTILEYYICAHRRDPRTTARDRRKDGRRSKWKVSSHELVCLLGKVVKAFSLQVWEAFIELVGVSQIPICRAECYHQGP